MADILLPATAVDLSRLPPPTIVPQLGFEAINAAILADLQARLPGFDATLESEPAIKLIEAFAYRELVLRQVFDDAARQMLLAYAVGPNLDQLGALMDVPRLVVTAANPDTGAAAVMEPDDAFRQRIALAPESFSVAGPTLAYVFHAKSASASVADASAVSPQPGEVTVTVLAVAGNGQANGGLLDAVALVVNDESVRPLTDHVTVQSAQIVNWALAATIWTFDGPDRTLVLAAARAKLDVYLAESRRLGRDITISSLHAALTVPGVQRVVLASPLADVACTLTQAAHCTGIAIAHGGYDD